MLQIGRCKTIFLTLVSRRSFVGLLRLIILADSPEVQTWMEELDGFDIPDFNATVDGTCAGDPAAAAQAASRGWWSCGGYTRPTGA